MTSIKKRSISYFLGGVNGVGKSTFSTEIVTRNPEFSLIKGSSFFMEWLGLDLGDYSSLRLLPKRYKHKELNRMMISLLSSPSNKKSVLIDAHYFHYNYGRLIDATGKWMSMVDVLLVVTADVKKILSRIEKDNKNRDLFYDKISEKEKELMIEHYLEETLQKAQKISNKYKIPLFVLDNSEDNTKGIVKNFLEIHNKIINK